MEKNIFEIGSWITVNDRMQSDYRYKLNAPAGENFASNFTPYYTPKEMLEMGVFEGKYMNDCTDEFPADWFENARISDQPDATLNCFKIKSRQPLQEWQRKGWIIAPDPRGWFQWYCRYYLGRRIPEIDTHQIKRHRAFTRHAGAIKANCEPGNLDCRPKQRQALLQWGHDPFI